MIWIWVLVLLGLSHGKIYDRCELARELKFVHEAPDHQLATWVCIAEHESQYNTSIVGHLNGDGSGDHGIFQISDQFWCSPPGKGLACGLSCADLEDDDISDDYLCAQRIYKEHKHLSGDGFNAWAVYKPHCKGPKAERYLKDCFNGSEGSKTITTPATVAAHGFFNTVAGRASTSTEKPTSEPFLSFRSPSIVQSRQFIPIKSEINSLIAPKSTFLSQSRVTSTETPFIDPFFTPTTTYKPTISTTTFTPIRSSTSGLIIFNPTATTQSIPVTRRTIFGFGNTFYSPSTTTIFTPTVSSPVFAKSSTVSYAPPIFIINGVKWY